MLTGGQVADCTAGAELLERLPACEILHGDKGYDANAIRRQVEDRGAAPNIPPKANRNGKNCFSPFLYRNRNAIERMLCRLKDFRPAATRYDRNAANLFSPGIFWSGLSVNRFGSEVQHLQMNSYGVRPLRVFRRRPKL